MIVKELVICHIFYESHPFNKSRLRSHKNGIRRFMQRCEASELWLSGAWERAPDPGGSPDYSNGRTTALGHQLSMGTQPEYEKPLFSAEMTCRIHFSRCYLPIFYTQCTIMKELASSLLYTGLRITQDVDS